MPALAARFPLLRSRSISCSAVVSSEALVLIADAANWYSAAVQSAPLPTAAATASTLAITGDVLAQWRAAPGEPISLRRTSGFAIFGALYTGCFQYTLFSFLIATCDGTTLQAMFNDALRGAAPYDVSAVPDPTLLPFLGAMERTLINQLIIIPLAYYPLFFLVTGLTYGQTVEQMRDRAKSLFVPLLRRNLLFWLPVQFCQFAFIEAEMQLPFVCVAGLAWNIILSTVSLQQDTSSTDGTSSTADGAQPVAGSNVSGDLEGRVVPIDRTRARAASESPSPSEKDGSA